ncbi:MAG TPA: FxsA family protein [Mesorhizobium sp.]|jgi:UPF0716 protein FxsA|nr:FxsA family protein [Mesorhizobium sp.]
MIRLLLLLLPLLEIAGFILVGQALGVLPTLGLVLGAAVIGLLLVRRAGRQTLARVQGELQAGRDPGPRVVNAFLDLVAGLLLIVPGFLTDILAIVILLPPLRARAWRALKSRVQIFGARGARARPKVIELDRTDFSHESPPRPTEPGASSSPWSGPR